MNGTIYQRIEDNAHFRELVEKRQRFATILSIIMLAVYIGFILLIAFAPGWLYWLSFGNWKLSLAISISLKPAFCGWESRRWLGC